MHAAFSLIFLTTLIGVGQGLFLALFTGQYYSSVQLLAIQDTTRFFVIGSLISFIFLIAGLVASSFHLNKPLRAWRTVTRWYSCWLSREVIVLPTLVGLVFLYGVIHFLNRDMVIFSNFLGSPFTLTLLIGALGSLAALALFLCTSMIYAGIKFIWEWSTPLTLMNYILLGAASGFTLAVAISAHMAPDLVEFYIVLATIITTMAFISRSVSLVRNDRLHTNSSYETMFSIQCIKWLFMVSVFPVPIILLYIGKSNGNAAIFVTAFAIQYIGLVAERWVFFSQVNHPETQYLTN